MLQSEIRKVIELLDYETRRKELRKEFHEHGVRFYDKHGEGFIRNGVKHYCDTLRTGTQGIQTPLRMPYNKQVSNQTNDCHLR